MSPSYPSSSRVFRRSTGPYPLKLESSTENLPSSLQPNDLVLRMRAVSLNFRDVAMLQEGRYPAGAISGGIPASDCAAEVVAVGEAVTKFKVGDRAGVTQHWTNLTGTERDEDWVALGGDVDGVLAEYRVVEEKFVVKLPEGMGWEEASTIGCAGVTAYNALNRLQNVQPNSYALLEDSDILIGTGGVSLFALLLCLAASITPIITSSSDSKLAQIKELDPRILGINYKEHSDVADEALRLSDGKGVDFVVNNIGPSSIPNDIKALRKRYGTVSLVGFLGGHLGELPGDVFMQLMGKVGKIQGIAVGSRMQFEALNSFIEEKKVGLEPLIDHRKFTFKESNEAFEYLLEGKHTGKVVITF